jgi:hypothetical protein
MKVPVLLTRPAPVAPTPDSTPAPPSAGGRPLLGRLEAAAPALIFLAALAAGAAVGVGLGYWWVTSLVGLAIGAILPWPRLGLGAAALAGLVAWGGPIAWQATHLPVTRTAEVVAAIMGLAGLGAVGPIAITLLVGVLLCWSGAWVGSAARELVESWFEETNNV